VDPSVARARTTVLLVRHGARYDYANKQQWRDRCARHGHEPSDPPLSALGHEQARETAVALARENPGLILASPYYRVLQTAQPLAHALNVPICVDHCLAEFGHSPQKIAPPGARVPVLPEIDDEYVPVLDRLCGPIDSTGKESAVAYFRRLLLFKRALATQRFTGQTIVCFSHAASVALVGALTGCSTLQGAGKFAPCGIYKLVSDDGGQTWQIEARGDDNSGHCTTNDPTTFPWGFIDSSSNYERHEAAWHEALALGPTDPSHKSRQPQQPPTCARAAPGGSGLERAAWAASLALVLAAAMVGNRTRSAQV